MEFKFRTGKLPLVIGVAGVLAPLVIIEGPVQDGGNFRNGSRAADAIER
jgi:hypothetical protein